MDNLNSTLENKLVFASGHCLPPLLLLRLLSQVRPGIMVSVQSHGRLTPSFQPDGHFIVLCFRASCSCLAHDASAQLSA